MTIEDALVGELGKLERERDTAEAAVREAQERLERVMEKVYLLRAVRDRAANGNGAAGPLTVSRAVVQFVKDWDGEDGPTTADMIIGVSRMKLDTKSTNLKNLIATTAGVLARRGVLHRHSDGTYSVGTVQLVK